MQQREKMNWVQLSAVQLLLSVFVSPFLRLFSSFKQLVSHQCSGLSHCFRLRESKKHFVFFYFVSHCTGRLCSVRLCVNLLSLFAYLCLCVCACIRSSRSTITTTASASVYSNDWSHQHTFVPLYLCPP